MIFKFGGTSVADAARIRHVADLVTAASPTPVVVVSALAGETDRLLEVEAARERGDDPAASCEAFGARHRAVARELAGDDAPALSEVEERISAAVRALLDPALARLGSAERGDRIRACGEDVAVHLLTAAIRARGREARVVDARSVVRTDARFGRARPDEAAMTRLASEHLRPLLERRVVPVVQGFVGATADGRTTTLGRGGSDYSASLLAAALGAAELHIWTDVAGVLSGDPRAVDQPRVLDRLGFEEAVELAYFGAKVLHPMAAKHAVARGLSVHVRSTFSPESPGTLILADRWGSPGIAAVAFKPAVALIQVRSQPGAMPYGFLARVFEILSRHRVPVDLVATSHTSTAFTLDEVEEIHDVAEELGRFAEVDVQGGLATVTVVGRGLLEEPGVNALVFWAVERTPVRLISQATDVSLSFVVDGADAPDVVRRLHVALIELRDGVRPPAAHEAGRTEGVST